MVCVVVRFMLQLRHLQLLVISAAQELWRFKDHIICVMTHNANYVNVLSVCCTLSLASSNKKQGRSVCGFS